MKFKSIERTIFFLRASLPAAIRSDSKGMVEQHHLIGKNMVNGIDRHFKTEQLNGLSRPTVCPQHISTV